MIPYSLSVYSQFFYTKATNALKLSCFNGKLLVGITKSFLEFNRGIEPEVFSQNRMIFLEKHLLKISGIGEKGSNSYLLMAINFSQIIESRLRLRRNYPSNLVKEFMKKTGKWVLM